MPRTKVLASALLLLALLASGCTNVSSTVTVINQKLPATLPSKTFAFRIEQTPSADREKYLHEVEKQLANHGWRRLPDGSPDASYTVIFIYRQLRNEQHILTVNKEADYKPDSLFSDPSGPGKSRVSTPESGTADISSYIYFAMAVDIVDSKSAADNKSIWTASVMAQSATEEPGRTYPAMIDSLFKNFPGKEGYKYVITQSARELK